MKIKSLPKTTEVTNPVNSEVLDSSMENVMSLALLRWDVEQPNYLRVFWFSAMLQLCLPLCLGNNCLHCICMREGFLILVNHLRYCLLNLY